MEARVQSKLILSTEKTSIEHTDGKKNHNHNIKNCWERQGHTHIHRKYVIWNAFCKTFENKQPFRGLKTKYFEWWVMHMITSLKQNIKLNSEVKSSADIANFLHSGKNCNAVNILDFEFGHPIEYMDIFRH